jgi:hypothetical protein
MKNEGTPVEGFGTPEEAAVSGWPEAAKPRVLQVARVSDDVMNVLVDTEPSHPMWVRCERGMSGWELVGDFTG